MIRWTDDRNKLLRRLWFEGALVKSICATFACSRESLSRQRRRLGLPRRNNARGVGHSTRRVQIQLSDEMYNTAQHIAHQHCTNLSGYVRALIRRDTGVQA